MCEVTNDNFESKFQEISYNLQKANYIAIDTEFTGLHLENFKPSITDTAEQRYQKLKKAVQQFNIVQFGLCTFRYCSDQKIFITDTYNFYLYPRNYGINKGQNACFQSSAIEFLCKYDFDFNKLTYKGISYLNNKQEKQLESKLNKQVFFAGIERDIDEKLLQKICSEITDWLLHAQVGEYFDLSKIDGLKDFVIHKELRNRFDTIWTYPGDKTIVIEKITKQKRDELNQSENENEIRQMIDMLLGFTKVFRLIVQFKKPLVFHNGFMDLLFMYEKFVEPLPETMKEFTRNVNEMFPLIYDTKHISLESKKVMKEMKEMFDSTILDGLFTSLNREVAKKCALYMPTIKHSATSADYLLNARPHEAGYDAFMTGTILLKLAHAIAYFNSKKCYNIRANNMNDYFLVIKPFENRVKLIKASLDHINFAGPNPKPTTLFTYTITSKSPSLSIYELIKNFSAIGDLEVFQISRNSARITVDNYSKERLMKYLKNNNEYQCSRDNTWPSLNLNLNSLIGIGLLSTAILVAYSCKRSL